MANLVPWNKCSLEVDDIPVAIISLEVAQSRRSTLIDRGFLSDLVNGFWPACDMRGLPDSELQSYKEYSDVKRIYGRPPVPAEIGCLFSHSAIIKWLSEQSTVSSIIVFEDDVIPAELNVFEKLTELAEDLSGAARAGKPFICHLGPRPEQWKLAYTRNVHKDFSHTCGLDLHDFVDVKARLWRAHAYIISKAAADRYTEVFKKTGFLADDWKFIMEQTRSKLIFVNPPLFIQDEEVESTIDPEKARDAYDSSKALSSNRRRNGLTGTLRVIKRGAKSVCVQIFRSLPSIRL